MANLEKIRYPDHLNDHTLSAQELALLSDQQKPLAKDWNVLNRKMDWIIREVVLIHNTMVEHDNLMDAWKKFLWLFGIITGGGTGVAALIYAVLKIIGDK